ncbi:PAS domain-containing protein [Roseomonas sp. GC11]|uniref:HWE histidine kinase domain-containing protein n=1 Tax=Roseomonas sp. GC11 TaxID=2950546 RepID=UPI00210E341B|nr:HWE histidine kinase domain-containing protein [Roseomonas sp. GC11]MCQ4159571.1 PAS domain-containing protein [Roseomonas sp. GC11]
MLKRTPAPLRPFGRRGRRLPLAMHLGLLGLVLLVPVILFAGILTHAYLRDRDDALRREALDSADRIMTRLEEELAGWTSALQVLAASPVLSQQDITPLRLQAEAVSQLIGGEITLQHWDAEAGRALPAPEPDTPGATEIAAMEDRAAETRQPVRSGLIALPGGRFIVMVTVPVLREGRLTHLLTLRQPAARLRQIFAGPLLPLGWSALLVDGEGRIIASTDERERQVGGQISQEAQRRASTRSGVWINYPFGEEPLIIAHVSSRDAGWRVGVLVPLRLAQATARQSFLFLALVSIGLVMMTVLLALLFARRIASSVEALAETARRLGQGEQVPAPSIAIRELHNVGAALAAASITLRSRGQALAESEAQLARALTAARIATWEWEVETDTFTGSRGREALYGRPAGSLRSTAALLSATHPEDRARILETLEHVHQPDGPGSYEILFRTIWPDGRIRWLHTHGGVLARDAQGRPAQISGVVMDVTEAQASAERERLLAAEVDHRARNVLTVVQSLLRMSRADDPAHFVEAVRGRIGALARAHTLLSRERWGGSDLRSVTREAMPTGPGALAVTIHGPSLALAPHVVQPLAMVLHEMATNAQQHGALSAAGGRVNLQWRLDKGDLVLDWTEQGGPPPALTAGSPAQIGLGLKVVEGTIRRQLGGSLTLDWRMEGLACQFRLPLARVALKGQPC